MSGDEDEQSDEMMVLRSIFDKDTFQCDLSRKPYEGRVTVSFQPGSYEFVCRGDVISFKYVPSIVLEFSLPPDYPSLSPPVVRLSCRWLESAQIGNLSRKLNKLWKDGLNTVILFTWITFLQEETLKFLNVEFPISVTLDDLRELSFNNIQRLLDEFSKGFYECPVCFCERPGHECFQLETCEHIFCKDCLSEYLSISIGGGGVRALFCPADKCKSYVNQNEIKRLVSEKDYERYERLLLQKTLDAMSDVDYCPRPSCGKPVVVDEEDNLGMCLSCDLAFCVRCRLTYHGVQRCYVKLTDDDMLELGKAYATGDEKEKMELEELYGKREVREYAKLYVPPVVEPIKMEVPSGVKRSPCCGEMMQKISGCDHVYCPNCKLPFNWSGARPFDVSILYNSRRLRLELSESKSRMKAKERRYVAFVDAAAANADGVPAGDDDDDNDDGDGDDDDDASDGNQGEGEDNNVRDVVGGNIDNEA